MQVSPLQPITEDLRQRITLFQAVGFSVDIRTGTAMGGIGRENWERIVTHEQQVNKHFESKKLYWFCRKATASPRRKVFLH